MMFTVYRQPLTAIIVEGLRACPELAEGSNVEGQKLGLTNSQQSCLTLDFGLSTFDKAVAVNGKSSTVNVRLKGEPE